MSAWLFAVHHRAVDLMAMTAARALRENLDAEDELRHLRRDDLFILEPSGETGPDSWVQACSARANWFNPNKHRFAFFAVEEGALKATENDRPWPEPWLKHFVTSDHPAMQGCTDLEPRSAWERWLDLPCGSGLWAGSILAWNREGGVAELDTTHWPADQGGHRHLILWTFVLVAPDAEQAERRMEALAITRSRREGLLIQPHMQNFDWLQKPWACHQQDRA